MEFFKILKASRALWQKVLKIRLGFAQNAKFLDPHQIFQENQGFIAFLCGNIFQIFAISVIFSSNFLSDIVIVALTWLKKGPKKEN